MSSEHGAAVAPTAHGSHGGHPPITHDTYDAAKIGMWLFLFTEVLLFGGLFILYSAYRFKYPHEFHEAGQHLNFKIGVANTFILLTSSLTMALSITALQRGQKGKSLALLGFTIACGFAFLVNKYFEWSHEIHNGIYPGSAEMLKTYPHGEVLFFGLYYTMTGLHGLHVVAGITVLSIIGVFVAKGWVDQKRFVKLENGGLYWHLVDVIWIFLLPLFYLAA